MVYVKSNDALYITQKSKIKDSKCPTWLQYSLALTIALEKPAVTISLPLISNEKHVYMPRKQEEADKWIATLKLSKVKGYWYQRYLGKVRTLYVFNSPV
jgi:hypothetical protein